MVQLRWLWTHALCLVTMATSGLLALQSLHLHDILSEEISNPTAFSLPMEITNRVFTAALLNPTSEEYQTLYKEVCDLLENVYDCPDYDTCPTNTFYGGVRAITFSSGSVIANATVVFNTGSINPTIVFAYFHLNVNTVEPKTLQLNLDYTTRDRITFIPVPATTTTTITTTTTTNPTTTTTTTTTPTTTTTTPTTTTPTTTTPTTSTTTTPTTTTPTTTTATPTTSRTTTTTPTTPTTTTHTTTTTTPTTTTPTTPKKNTMPTTTTTTTPTTPKKNTMPTTTTTTTPITTTTAPTTTIPTSTRPSNTTTPTTTTPTTTTTPETMTTTPTTTPTTTAPTTPALTSAHTKIQDPTTSSSKTNTSPDDNVLVPTTKTNHGNHSDIYTTDGRENPTQDPAENNITTVNPHEKPTDSHNVSTGKPNNPLTSGGSNSDGSREWVPGWAIALLVLGSVVLLLLIIIFIMMLVRWCCKKTESDQMDTTEAPYYTEQKQPPQDPLPVYSPQSPATQKPGSASVIVGGTPKKNRTGFYNVNP